MNRNITTLFITNIIIGTIIAISSNHWFLIWIGLETNTLSIIPLLTFLQSPRNIEASIKYFLIQALAAATILNSALINAWTNGSWLINTEFNEINCIIITGALFLKLSLAPFHIWFPDVISGINLLQGLLLTTWQKIAPLIITLNIINTLNLNMILYCSILSIIIGAWNGLNQTQTRKILAYSSISHIGWITITGIFNQNASIIMLLIYITINTSIFLSLTTTNIKNIANINKNNATWTAPTITLCILSLGGLPPLTGFLNKLISLNVLTQNNSTLTTIPLIVGSLISLFFYLRISFNSNLSLFPQNALTIINTRNTTPSNTNTNSILITLALNSIIAPPILISILS
uniref:NADH-ubiquinone oxidoreductase chain 2 n=1 Tax=Neogymnocrinus richeri TaxID=710152 RepID=Q2QJF6_9ECHI|nr:NADH dehydrogenase subunit 2 [Neogymnocrinus richeri]AAY51810.1 NADH dehydrogenase subunit 2 [Neogymnocrinus richeri]